MKVFAVAMHKGGVGKTAITTNVAAVLADRGRRVLVVDADPQNHQARHFGIAAPERGLAESMFQQVPLPSIAFEVRDRLFLVGSGANLSSADVHLSGKPDGHHRLRTALQTVKEQFDYVFIDCPPNLGLLTLNALVAASRPIVPVQTEQAAADSLVSFHKTCMDVREFLNPSLEDLWILPSMFQGNTTHQRAILEHLRGNPWKCTVLDPIRRTVRIADAFARGCPVYETDRTASDGFERVAERIEAA